MTPMQNLMLVNQITIMRALRVEAPPIMQDELGDAIRASVRAIQKERRDTEERKRILVTAHGSRR